MINISKKGDDYISPFERKLWDFTYTVLHKFGCPIQFKVEGPDVRIKLNQIITFFVPDGRDDVVEYIVQEWSDDVSSFKQDDESWFWNTEINVMYFSGTELYTEKSVIQEISQNMVMYLHAKINKKDVNIEDFTKLKTKH